MDDSLTNRIAPVFMGIFLFFFGLPFTLVPFMIFLDGAIDPSYPFAAIFMIAFTIPFLMAGLLVQFMGLSMIRTGIRGPIDPIDPTSIPRKLPPGPDAISITEHPDQSYIGSFFRQSEPINGRDWYRKEKTPHRLYYYAQNEGGSAGWSLDDRNDSGRRDWFDGGWFPYEGFEVPIGRKSWAGDVWVSIEESESSEDGKKWWQ